MASIPQPAYLREEKAKYVYTAIVVFILLTGVYVKLFFGPFF